MAPEEIWQSRILLHNGQLCQGADYVFSIPICCIVSINETILRLIDGKQYQ